MDDKSEMIQNFADMVNATERMSKPWQEECQRWKDVQETKQKHHTIQLILCNLFWAFIVGLLIWFAYMTPVDVSQEQNFDQQVQTQDYSEGVTSGG